MPIYCYKTENGDTREEFFTMEDVPESFLGFSLQDEDGLGDGVEWFRDFQAERTGIQTSDTAGWPMTCVGSGVNADQADDLRQHLKSRGVPTDVTEHGDPVYRDANHRKKALKARGFMDKAAYV